MKHQWWNSRHRQVPHLLGAVIQTQGPDLASLQFLRPTSGITEESLGLASNPMFHFRVPE